MSEFFNLLDEEKHLKALVSGSSFPRQLKKRKGRYFFPVIHGQLVRQCLVRFDPDTATISGDLYKDHEETQWICSWRSEVIFQNRKSRNTWELVAICELYSKGSSRLNGDKLLLKVGWGKEDKEKITHFEMGALKYRDEPKPTEAYRFSLTDDDAFATGHRSSLRRMKLNLHAEETFHESPFFDACFRKLLEKRDVSFGKLKESFKRKLSPKKYPALIKQIYQSGSFVELSKYDDLYKELQAARAKDVVANLDIVFAKYLESIDNPPPNPRTYTILFSSAEDIEGNKNVPLGRALLGNESSIQRYYSRTTALIFPNEMLGSFNRARKLAGLNLVEPDKKRGEGSLSEKHFDVAVADFTDRMLFTIMHELAHLMNLPHAWQRGEFGGEPMRGEPHELSWTNYSILHPFGRIVHKTLPKVPEKDRTDAEEEIKKKRTARTTTFFSNLRKNPDQVGFSKNELFHIHHAPFTQIAAGGKAFNDVKKRKISLDKPSVVPSPLQVFINGSEDDVYTADRYTGIDASERFQPLSGRVELDLTKVSRLEDTDTKQKFRFGSGRLFVLFRAERKSANLKPELHPVFVYRPRPLDFGLTFNSFSMDNVPLLGDANTLKTAFPLIPIQGEFYKFIDRAQLYEGKQLRLTLQVVYLADNNNLVRSDFVRCHLNGKKIHPVNHPKRITLQTLLKDPNLALLQQAALYYSLETYPKLHKITEIKDLVLSDEVEGLISDHKNDLDLTWLIQLRNLVRERDGVGQLALEANEKKFDRLSNLKTSFAQNL